MPYSSSDYDTAVSAFNVLPESMAVENLIRLRQGNEHDGMINRKLARVEEDELADRDAFRGYSDVVSGLKGLEPEERLNRLSEAQVDHPEWTNNKMVQDSMRALSESGDRVAKSYGNRADIARDRSLEARANSDLKMFQEQQEKLEATYRADVLLGFDKANSARQDFDSLNLAQGNDRSNLFIQTVSGTKMDQKMKDKLIEINSYVGTGPESKGRIDALTKFGKSLVMGDQVVESSRYKTFKHQGIIKDLEKAGVDLSDDAAVRAAIGSNKNALAAYEEGQAVINHYGKLKKDQAGVAEFVGGPQMDRLRELAKEASKTMDWTEYDAQAAVLSGKASTVEGQVRANYDEHERDFKFVTEQRQIEEDKLKNLNIVSQMDKREGDSSRADRESLQKQIKDKNDLKRDVIRTLTTSKEFITASPEKQSKMLDTIMPQVSEAENKWAPAR